MRQKISWRDGFTLVEMLLTLGILGVLAVLVVQWSHNLRSGVIHGLASSQFFNDSSNLRHALARDLAQLRLVSSEQRSRAIALSTENGSASLTLKLRSEVPHRETAQIGKPEQTVIYKWDAAAGTLHRTLMQGADPKPELLMQKVYQLEFSLLEPKERPRALVLKIGVEADSSRKAKSLHTTEQTFPLPYGYE
jgi:prepilin-type N-terminal cleavage/methylation domain-containing protein